MSRSLKSRNYLVKCLGFLLLLGFISLGAIGGCGNNDGEQDGTQALTERDFFNNLNLFANPENGVVVVFLEPSETPEEDNLTGELGFDVIPYRYNQDLNHTICFVDENVDSTHFIILQNSDGEEVLRAQANGGCITEVIEAGDYEMVLTHGEHVDETETVFLIPAPEDEQVTKRDEFDQKEIKTANGFSYKKHRYLPGGLVKFFESISNVFTHPARAQAGTGTPSVNVTTLINTNACVGCDLIGVDLNSRVLSGANLSGANVSKANLGAVTLIGANLSNAILVLSNLKSADLSSANLTGAAFNGSDMTSANLTSAIMTNTSFFMANLTFACLTDMLATNTSFESANMTGANMGDYGLIGGSCFAGTTWCDGLHVCLNEETIAPASGIFLCAGTNVNIFQCIANPIDPNDFGGTLLSGDPCT